MYFAQVAPTIDLARRHAASATGVSGQADTGSRYRHGSDRDDDDSWDDDDVIDDYEDSLPFRGRVTSKSVTVTTKTTPIASTTPSDGAGQRKRPGTYLYCFAYPTRFDVYPRWAEGVQGDDLAYVFGAPVAGLGGVTGGGAVAVGWAGGGATIDPFTSSFTRADRTLSELVMRYWVGFIHTG